jgi:hypothetical protein
MDWQAEFWFVFFICMAVHLSYGMGKRHGVAMTLDYLKQDGQIDFDED